MQALGVEFPGCFPLTAADIPCQDIVFQLVAGMPVQRGQNGFGISKDILLLKALHCCVQSTQDGIDDAFVENVLRAGQIQGYAAAVEGHTKKVAVLLHIRANNGNVPEACSLRSQLANFLGSEGTLVQRCGASAQRYCLPQLRLGWIGALEQTAAHCVQQVLPTARDSDHLHGNPILLGVPYQHVGSLPCLFISQKLRPGTVTAEADRHQRRIGDKMGQNIEMLSRKIREAVHIQGMVGGKIAVLQQFQ